MSINTQEETEDTVSLFLGTRTFRTPPPNSNVTGLAPRAPGWPARGGREREWDASGAPPAPHGNRSERLRPKHPIGPWSDLFCRCFVEMEFGNRGAKWIFTDACRAEDIFLFQ